MIWFETKIPEALQAIESLTNTKEQYIAKIWLGYYYNSFSLKKQLHAILEDLQGNISDLDDPYLWFHHHMLHFFHFIGWGTPIIDKKRASFHKRYVESRFEQISFADRDDENIINGLYYFYLYAKETKTGQDEEKQLDYLDRSIKFYSRDLDDETYGPEQALFLAITSVFRGRSLFYRQGDFQEAKNAFLRSDNLVTNLEEKYQVTFIYRTEILEAWSYLDYLQGNIDQAIAKAKNALTIVDTFESPPPVYRYNMLSHLARYQYAKGDYHEALTARKKALAVSKEVLDRIAPFHYTSIYFDYLYHFYQRYMTTLEQHFLERTETILREMQRDLQGFEAEAGVKDFLLLAEALLLKHGNLKKKVRAMHILEDLLRKNFQPVLSSMHLLELHFEDYSTTSDRDTLEQIDQLFSQMRKLPLQQNPLAIGPYVTQQILLAKYSFYIKGDLTEAIDTLGTTRREIRSFGLDNLEDQLEAEIKELEDRITRWEGIDASALNRVKKTRFSRYIQKALSELAK